MAWHLPAPPGHVASSRLATYLLLCVAAAPFVKGKSYNDCTRKGAPDPASVPVWNGDTHTFFEDYRPLADIQKFVGALASSHPNLVKLRTIGKSWQGRPLTVMEITSGGNSADKPLIFLQGGIHAREWIATAAVLYLAHGLLARADAELGIGPVTSMLKEFTFAILSPVNPDGYVYTWEADRFWRKTRSNREHCALWGVAGVDANRNWGYTRGIIVKVDGTEGSETTDDIVNPCLETYEGPNAFSEPEVLAVATYLRQRQNSSFARSSRDAAGQLVAGPGYASAFIDYHSFAMMLMPPWGVTADWPEPPDSGYMKDLCTTMVETIKRTSGRIFASGPDLLPSSPGTAPDWAYGELGVRATMTIELEGTYEGGSFCLAKQKILSVGEEQFQVLLTLVAHLLAHGSEPSSKYGLFAGTPPSPTVAVGAKLWLQTKALALHRLPAAEIGALAFGIVALSAGALTFWRWRQLHRSSSSLDIDEIE